MKKYRKKANLHPDHCGKGHPVGHLLVLNPDGTHAMLTDRQEGEEEPVFLNPEPLESLYELLPSRNWWGREVHQHLTQTVDECIDQRRMSDIREPIPPPCRQGGEMCSMKRVALMCNGIVLEWTHFVRHTMPSEVARRLTHVNMTHTCVFLALLLAGLLITVSVIWGLLDRTVSAYACHVATANVFVCHILSLLAWRFPHWIGTCRVRYELMASANPLRRVIWNSKDLESPRSMIKLAKDHGTEWATIFGKRHCSTECLANQATRIANLHQAENILYGRPVRRLALEADRIYDEISLDTVALWASVLAFVVVASNNVVMLFDGSLGSLASTIAFGAPCLAYQGVRLMHWYMSPTRIAMPNDIYFLGSTAPYRTQSVQYAYFQMVELTWNHGRMPEERWELIQDMLRPEIPGDALAAS